MIDFGITDEEQAIVQLAADFATDVLGPQARAHEAARGVTAAARDRFTDSGLDLLASGGDDAEGISIVARMRALTALARADAAAALALWAPHHTRTLAELLGAPDTARSAHLVDDVDAERARWAPLGAAPVLWLEAPGRWRVVQLEGTPVASLALHATGPIEGTGAVELARGEAPDGATERVCAEVRLCTAGLLVGLGQAACAYAADYARERVAFGRRLADHQGLAFLFADLAAAVHGAGLLVDRAAWDLERGEPTTCTHAHLEAIEAAALATSGAVQLLGGHGYMKDHPVEKWMREARALACLHGGADASLRAVVA